MLEIVITMFVVLFAFLAGGMWIGWTLAVTGTVLLAIFRDIPLDKLLAQYAWNILTTQELLALPLFIIARFALTMVSYSSGAAGGIFAPLLGLGALGGLLFGAGVHALPLAGAAGLTPEIFCVIGMGALFTAIVRAPLTGIVLMIELTGSYSFMLPLLVGCLMAYGVAELMGNTPIYEALRLRSRPVRA